MAETMPPQHLINSTYEILNMTVAELVGSGVPRELVAGCALFVAMSGYLGVFGNTANLRIALRAAETSFFQSLEAIRATGG